MRRSTIVIGLGLVGLVSVLYLPVGRGEPSADEADLLAARAARIESQADLQIRYALAVQELAELELRLARDARRVGTISDTQLRRAEASAKVSRLAVEVARQRPRRLASDAIHAALEDLSTGQFEEAPLGQAVRQLARRHSINIVLHRRALDDVGVEQDTPVSLDLIGVSLRTVLERMLAPLDLTFLVKDEVLLITTIDDASQRLETKIYDVHDLLIWESVAYNEGPYGYNYDSLIQVITSTVEPITWDNVGGPGSIEPFDGMLVITQTQDIHRQILETFTTLRATRLPVIAAARCCSLKSPTRDWALGCRTTRHNLAKAHSWTAGSSGRSASRRDEPHGGSDPLSWRLFHSVILADGLRSPSMKPARCFKGRTYEFRFAKQGGVDKT
jgi:hypothetical protein